jgi:hypothetical protein
MEIRPLTILAGANSSGKSSMMQPLLLLKQTLEASFDPGSLLLDGPNVRVTSPEQVLTHLPSSRTSAFSVGIELGDGHYFRNIFSTDSRGDFTLKETHFKELEDPNEWVLSEHDVQEKLWASIPSRFQKDYRKLRLNLRKARCFFEIDLIDPEHEGNFLSFAPATPFYEPIRQLVHVPGLRDNPARFYRKTAVSNAFPGTFDHYVASVIHERRESEQEIRWEVSKGLAHLGLSDFLTSDQKSASEIELRVCSLPVANWTGPLPTVNIADVGIGVAQVLPVLAALLVAVPGQLVYIEQPELHLHPRAQLNLAELLMQAALRGVQVVIETHSDLLLIGVQTLVAQGRLAPENVILHWFSRQLDGLTDLTSADLDEAGTFGTWPEDFAEVSLRAQSAYLDAVEQRHVTR